MVHQCSLSVMCFTDILSHLSELPGGYSSKEFAFLLIIVAYLDQLHPLPLFQEMEDGSLHALDDGWPMDQFTPDHGIGLKLVEEFRNRLRHSGAFLSDLYEAENTLRLWSSSCLQSRSEVHVSDIPPPSTLAIRIRQIASVPKSRLPLGRVYTALPDPKGRFQESDP